MRRMNGLGVVIFLVVLIVIEYYAFTAVRFALRNMKPTYRNMGMALYILIGLAWVATLFMFPAMRSDDFNKVLRNALISFGMGFLITKVLIASVLLIDDIRRVFFLVASLFYPNEATPMVVSNGMSRSDFMMKLGLLFGGSVFATMLYGMSNRYKYKIRSERLSFKNLPASFKGLKVVQISDIHSGSFNDREAVQKGINLINAQKPDIIFFTGDLVNNKSDEMEEYIDIFAKLKAPMGVFSILGNHDYGDYVEWESEAAKAKNLEALKTIHAQMGWKLLLNEHVVLKQGSDEIALLGVENISSKRFHSYGDLAKAYQGSEHLPFKILLSHDPSHWDGETNQNYKDIDLTLSGHTHGMQFGIEIPWIKWSPVQYIYKQWAGLYQRDNQYLYVNRGFGFLGYPGRVGILPEITILELV